MKDSMLKSLTKRDLFDLLKIIDQCLDCDDLDAFTILFYKLRKIAKFDVAVCTRVEPSQLPISLEKVMQPDFRFGPQKTIDTSQLSRCYKINAPLRVILSSLNISDHCENADQLGDKKHRIVIQETQDYCLSNGFIYGAPDNTYNRLILLVFAYHGHRNDQRCDIAIELAVPHLANTFRRLKHLVTTQQFHLTKREHEIINWVRMGKTSWEIAKIIDISVSCVNFHIDNIKKKLDAVNRAQAVAIAISNGLIKR